MEKLKKGLFVWSSSLILIFAIYRFIELFFYFDFKYILDYLPSIVYYGAIIAFGICLAARKNSLPICISLLIISLIEGYWMITSISYLIKSEQLLSIYGIVWAILYILKFISPVFLTVISFADLKNILGKVRKLWIVPAALVFLYFVIYLAYYIIVYIGYDLSSLLLSSGIELLYYIGFVMFALSFADLEKLKNVLDTTKGL